ncbi:MULTISPECIES: type II secretion system protein N [Marinobacter]|jgi:general secretion pathway protein C|uniref:type II secretion system protein N n=2 Tax=Marinobacteraceae TaxID=2887365 RepID=UPI00110852D3|nr:MULTISPECIES: type II secretion system protein N [Marinobacter]MCK2148843.1 general secretion pathway protein GspC [Marinobacter alexandrii]
MPFYNQRLPLLLTVIAGTAMVGVTAWQVYSFSQAQGHGSSSINAQQLVREGRDLSQTPEVDLTTLALFGTARQEGSAGPVETENLPETNLRLFLRGVLAADGEFPGSALIEDQKGNTEAYPVGEELPGNAKLRSVHANRVVIERGGKLENLFFPEEKNRSGMTVASGNQDEPEQSAPETQIPASNQASSPAADEQRREEIRRRLEQLRERLRNNSN